MIELKNIKKVYSDKVILDSLDLKINDGEMVAIVGESGAGKSTMLNLISILDSDYNGDYIFNGVKVNELSSKEKEKLRVAKIGMIFQSFYLIDYLTGLENVQLPLIYQQNNSNKSLAQDILKKLNIEYLSNQNVKDMSGGEKQRIAVARALVKNPDVLLADEPTGNLDKENSENVLNILKEINIKQGKTVIVVTHNQGISNYFDKIYKIEGKKVIEVNQI